MGIDWTPPLTIEATNAIFEAPRFGPPEPQEHGTWRPGQPLGLSLPGHDAWINHGNVNRFLLVPSDQDPSYRALCSWVPDSPSGPEHDWGRCFVRVAYPGEPRLLVEWLYWFMEPDELPTAPLGALSAEALAIARCFDVTDEAVRDPEACTAAILRRTPDAPALARRPDPPDPPALP